MGREGFFKVISRDGRTKARVGEIKTPHGKILTPAFVPVGSQATVKSMTPQDLQEVGTQVFFANTYHLYLRPGVEVIEKLGGLHRFTSWKGPIMTDSGGFQVFSLKGKADHDGVTFFSHLDGSKHYFTPEKSIEIQKKLGADMIIAFDECPPYPVSQTYAKTAMERTHRWALQSLEAFRATKTNQAIFGVIHGSTFEDLRKESAKFISRLDFDGLSIGGVAVGESKKEMIQVLDWVMPLLQTRQLAGKPVHLLGVGEIDDVFEAIERGVDMMDCVMPTRLARMGHVLVSQKSSASWRIKSQNEYLLDINKSFFTNDSKSIDESCHCYVCQNFSRAYLNHLFRARELLAYRLATYHNLFFMEKLFKDIRKAIVKGKFLELKKKYFSEV